MMWFELPFEVMLQQLPKVTDQGQRGGGGGGFVRTVRAQALLVKVG